MKSSKVTIFKYFQNVKNVKPYDPCTFWNVGILLNVGSSPGRGIQPIFSEEYVEREKEKRCPYIYM